MCTVCNFSCLFSIYVTCLNVECRAAVAHELRWGINFRIPLETKKERKRERRKMETVKKMPKVKIELQIHVISIFHCLPFF